MSKSGKYLVALAVLLVANLWLFLAGSDDGIRSAEKYFSTQDVSRVSSFVFTTESTQTTISKSGDGWLVNDQYAADEGFVSTLISILERVESGASIENWEGAKLGTVELKMEDNTNIQFDFSTNPTKTRSYFISETGANEVSVPGYRDNVIDIFTLHADQWRDRTIVDGSWRTIQEVDVKNAAGAEFKIKFQDKFFLFNGGQPSDSTAIVNYLNQFQQFQANEMISEGRFEELDSLATVEPVATIRIDDIKYEQPIELKIFPNGAGQPYHLVINQEGQRMVIDARRVGYILTSPN